MRPRHLNRTLPILAAAALLAGMSLTEALHLRHLKGHAQAALDHAIADVALRKMAASQLEEALRTRAPGRLDHVTIAAAPEGGAEAVAELTLPSAWPVLKRGGYRQVVTSKVTVQPSGA